MSFELHDYPGMPSVCAICKHDDCSKPGEMWVHLVTVEDRPAIGMNCVRLIADNVGLTKADEVIREISRPPTDEEVGRFMRHLFEETKDIPAFWEGFKPKPYFEVNGHDSSSDKPSMPFDSTGNVARQRTDSASKGKKRID